MSSAVRTFFPPPSRLSGSASTSASSSSSSSRELIVPWRASGSGCLEMLNGRWRGAAMATAEARD